MIHHGAWTITYEESPGYKTRIAVCTCECGHVKRVSGSRVRRALSKRGCRRCRDRQDAERGPCPTCGMNPPRRGEGRLGSGPVQWMEMYGHRCPHSEPCPGDSGRPPDCWVCQHRVGVAQEAEVHA